MGLKTEGMLPLIFSYKPISILNIIFNILG